MSKIAKKEPLCEEIAGKGCSLKKVLDIFLEKTPDDIDIEELKKHLLKIFFKYQTYALSSQRGL